MIIIAITSLIFQFFSYCLEAFMEHLSGSTEEIAQALLAYDRRGVSHLMFHIAPYRPESLARLEKAMILYRQMRSD